MRRGDGLGLWRLRGLRARHLGRLLALCVTGWKKRGHTDYAYGFGLRGHGGEKSASRSSCESERNRQDGHSLKNDLQDA
jgi:hypothetical protein